MNKKPTVLHEILAVEGTRVQEANAAMGRAISTFTSQVQLFKGLHTVYVPFDAESLEGAEEHQELSLTVPAVLNEMSAILSRAVDLTATKDVTNQSEGARSSVIVDDVEITLPLPATTLLMLESQLKQLGGVLEACPVLADGRDWVIDTAKGPDIYKDANSKTGFKTKKVINHKVLVEPTEHHPAQVERWSEDSNVGKTTTTEWSGMLSQAAKGEMLERLRVLTAAVKQARMRANMAEVTQTHVAQNLLNFVLSGVTSSAG